MTWSARFLRSLAKLRFKLLRHATINDIPVEKLALVIKQLTEDGWRVTYEYKGFDAWIDYGCVRLRKEFTSLACEWDNWTEGSIAGPQQVIEAIAARNGFTVKNAWRWSEWDQ